MISSDANHGESKVTFPPPKKKLQKAQFTKEGTRDLIIFGLPQDHSGFLVTGSRAKLAGKIGGQMCPKMGYLNLIHHVPKKCAVSDIPSLGI